MEITFKRSDAVRELALAVGVCEKRTTIPQLANVLIEADGESASLTATDLELGFRSSFPAGVVSGGAICLPANRLLAYLKALPDGEVKLASQANHWAGLSSGRSRTRIAGMSRESYPELPKPGKVIASLPLKSTSAMISRTGYAISKEESRFTLNGALLVLSPASMVMVATDGHRLSMVADNTGFADVSEKVKHLVPRKALAQFKVIAESSADTDVAEFSGDDNHLYFKFGERSLLARKLTGNFPDYERVLPKNHPHEVELAREEFIGALGRVSQFSDERSRMVRIAIRAGEMLISSAVAETGDSEESIPVVYGGPDVLIGFNADYIVDFLRSVADERVSFRFKDSNSAGEFRPSGDAGDLYRCIVMPMRV